MNMNCKIMDLMNDLVLMRDRTIGPQKFTVYLAKTTTEGNKASNRKTDSSNVSRRPPSSSERSVQDSTSKANHNNPNILRKSPYRPKEELRRPLNIARNATTHSSQLPLTLENSNDLISSTLLSPKIIPVRNTDPSQIAAKIESQFSNVRLTSGEREALISRILSNELEIQARLAAQAKELFSEADTFQRQSTPSKNDLKDKDELMVSLMKKRLQIESRRAAQERIIFSPSEIQQKIIPKAIPPQKFNITSDGTASTEKNKLDDVLSQLNRSAPVNGQKRQTRQNFGMSLAPILETSEPRDSIPRIDDGSRNVEGNNRHGMATILSKENDRQRQMESRNSGELIQDVEMDLLLSDESDSLDDLVIKDFAIRIVKSEPDPVTSSLPITEQVILESKKLKEMIESVKDRFQIKVAKDKFAEQNQWKKRQPNTSRSKSETHGIIETKTQTNDSVFKNDEPADHFMTKDNILDSHNWGNVALPKPLFDDPVEPSNSSFSETILNPSDMQFDDIFGIENVLEPTSLRSVSQHEPQLGNKMIRQSQQKIESLLDSIQKIEDLESPQFSDIRSDISIRSIPDSLNMSTIIRDFADPQHSVEKLRDTSNASASKQPKINVESVNQPLNDGINPAAETEHEKDIQKLKELIDSGALRSSILNQKFEEGVLDLLLRQSDSLWDPIVAGIPIIYFIPSRNHESGLLDTSIKEENLKSPLIKNPEIKLPKFMESLENEWTKENVEHMDTPEAASVHQNSNAESLLVPGLPEFSYKPVPGHFYRKKINIMDSKEESDDDYDILKDEEMNFDDLVHNVTEPAYDFRKQQILDDLEIKARIIRRMTKNSAVGSKDPISPREVGPERLELMGKNRSNNKPNCVKPVENLLKSRRSVSFVDNGEEKERSKHGSGVINNCDVDATPQVNHCKFGEIKRWTTLHMSEVKDLIEQARLAQGKL